MFQYMCIGIAQERHLRLLEAYEAASQTIRDARGALAPLLNEADALLGESRARTVQDALWAGATGLTKDALDLQRRGEFLMEADARVATQVAARAGDLLNRYLVGDALRNGWSYSEAEMRNELAQLRRMPREQQIRRANDIRRLEEALRILEGPNSALGVRGDLDASLPNVRVGPPLQLRGPNASARGRDLVIRALEDTADKDTILQDEFQAILHDNGNLTLVLPGVVDLTSKISLTPEFGWEEEHRTTRDLEMAAVSSSLSTNVEDNDYAKRVRDWLRYAIREGIIEPGAQTAIIGHSYGGDSALDLAADPRTNGELVSITHVVPMAYHTEPQFPDLPAGTQVLSLQNIWDVPVAAESVGSIARHPSNLKEPAGSAGRAAVEGAESVVDGGSWLINQTLDEIAGAVDEQYGIDVDVPDIPKVEFKHDDYRIVNNEVLLVEFEGGFSFGDFGHHQDRYVDFLELPFDPRVSTFLSGLDGAGFTSDGTTVSIDVTKPD